MRQLLVILVAAYAGSVLTVVLLSLLGARTRHRRRRSDGMPSPEPGASVVISITGTRPQTDADVVEALLADLFPPGREP